jgi:transcriptional regulator with XRE-family HTH domain
MLDANLHHPDVSTLGERITLLMKEKGLGVNELDRLVEQNTGYTSLLSRDKKKRPDATILQKYAEVLGVDYTWLVSGKGERHTGASKSPPLVTDAPRRIVENDSLNAWINAAFDPTVHKAAHVPAVMQTIQRGGTFRRHDTDPVSYVRTLFDSAASLEKHGEVPTPDLILQEIGWMRAAERQEWEPVLKALKARGRAWLREQGLEPPAPGTHHPLLDEIDEMHGGSESSGELELPPKAETPPPSSAKTLPRNASPIPPEVRIQKKDPKGKLVPRGNIRRRSDFLRGGRVRLQDIERATTAPRTSTRG